MDNGIFHQGLQDHAGNREPGEARFNLVHDDETMGKPGQLNLKVMTDLSQLVTECRHFRALDAIAQHDAEGLRRIAHGLHVPILGHLLHGFQGVVEEMRIDLA